MSFEESRQFTNQMAYQSMFSPPGFSFESPFAYQPSNGMDAQASTFPTSMNMPMQMPMPMAMDVDAEMDLGMKPTGNTGQGQGLAPNMSMRQPNNIAAMWASLSQESEQGKKEGMLYVTRFTSDKDKTDNTSDMFAAPPAQLSTGDRFSQLLERKLGMDTPNPSSTFPLYDSTPSNPQMPRQVDPMPTTFPSFPMGLDPNSFSWDKLAVETNLQDFNQVQIQPDLVAPIPAPYLQYNPNSMMANYDGTASQDFMRTPTPYPNSNGNHLGISPVQQQYLSAAPGPYMPYPEGFSSQPMAGAAFPVQSPMSTSNRSSPSSNSHQLITPQTASHPMISDGSWSSSFAPQGHFNPADTQSRLHPGSIPPPSFGRAHTTVPRAANDSIYHTQQSYQQGRQMPGPSASAPPASGSERTRLAAMGASLPQPPRAIAIKPSPSRPTLAVGPNGMWSRDMTASSSSQSINSAQSQSSQQYGMPVQRAPMRISPMDQSHMANPQPMPLPLSLPPAPSVTKRSRSGSSSSQSHRSSSHHSPNQLDNASGSKRPKMSMSVPHPMPLSSSDEHDQDHDDGERKVIIACHTCRARKLK
jgi:hypothetical protein